MPEPADHAVVVGASTASLLAARVLCGTYASVTVVERDSLTDDAAPRRGVPQGRHAHGLLARGREALEELLPGLTEELVALGVPAVDLQAQVRWVNSGRLLRQAPCGLLGLGVSRPLLESRIRARVRALPGVGLLDGCAATGLAASADGRRVTGLRVLPRGDGRGQEVIPADLVVDASGRGSRGPRWLEAVGYPVPRTEQVHIGLVYASRSYRRDPAGPDGAVVGGSPANPRGGALIAQEGDRWMVTLAGLLGDTPPLDHAGFTAFAGSLDAPMIHEEIPQAEPLSDAVRFRTPSSTRRRYERLARFPGVDGPRTPRVRAVDAYLERLHVAAEQDPVVGRAFLRVVNLVDRPERLLAPSIAVRVLRGQRAPTAVRGASATT